MLETIKKLAVQIGVAVAAAAVDETVRVKIRNYLKGDKAEDKKSE